MVNNLTACMHFLKQVQKFIFDFKLHVKLLELRCLYVCFSCPESLAFLVEFMRSLGMFIDLKL